MPIYISRKHADTKEIFNRIRKVSKHCDLRVNVKKTKMLNTGLNTNIYIVGEPIEEVDLSWICNTTWEAKKLESNFIWNNSGLCLLSHSNNKSQAFTFIIAHSRVTKVLKRILYKQMESRTEVEVHSKLIFCYFILFKKE